MNRQTKNSNPPSSRRDFLKRTGTLAAGATLAGAMIPQVHAASDDTIRLALVGCGGRGSGAAANAFQAAGGPVKLYAMADLFDDRLQRSYKSLKTQFAAQMDVPADRQFLGFDAYKKAIDSLRPGDIALLTAYAYCRPVQVAYAVQRGVHVFMEKPFGSDPGALHKLLAVDQTANKKNVKIAAGLMCRHSVARQAFIDRVHDGLLGDIQLIRAYRLDPGGQLGNSTPHKNELEWQIRHRTQFQWGGAGLFIELMIHQIDECCWLKDAWPVSANGMGGQVARSHDCGQNLHNYSIEYTFADGAKAMVYGRTMPNCYNDFATYVHGTKCAGQFSGHVHRATVHTYKDQRITADNIDWKAEKEPCSPWQAEWNVFLQNIRKDAPHNELRRAAESNFVSLMGRAASHLSRIVTWDEITASKFQFCPYVDDLTWDSPPPVKYDKNGYYPAPIPGQWTEL